MSFTVEIDVVELKIGRVFFETVDRLLRDVGMELELGDRVENPEPAAVLVRSKDLTGSAPDFNWPDFDFVGKAGELLSIPYCVIGGDNPGDGLVFSVSFVASGRASSLRVVGSGHCCRQWYEEYSRDLILRALVFLDLLRANFPILRAYCIEMESTGEVWFHMDKKGWQIRPLLPLMESEDESLTVLQDFSSQSQGRIEFDEDQCAFFYCGGHGQGIGLLRHNILDGSLLPETTIDDLYFSVDEDSEIAYLGHCWRANRGLDDLISQYGSPDLVFGPLLIPDDLRLAGQRDVKQQICYERINERFVVFFREYANGRVAVTLAGKEKAATS